MEYIFVNVKKTFYKLFVKQTQLLNSLFLNAKDEISTKQFDYFLVPFDKEEIVNLLSVHFIKEKILINDNEIIFQEEDWQPIKLIIREKILIVNASNEINPFSLFFSCYFPHFLAIANNSFSKMLETNSVIY